MKYKMFFLPWPANSSTIAFEITHCVEHESDADFEASVEEIASHLNLSFAYKEEM